MLMKYLKNEGIGRNMSEHEFMRKFKEFMASDKYKRNSYNFYRNEDAYPPMQRERMREMMGHNHYPEDFDMLGVYDQDRLSARFNRMSESMSEEDMYSIMKAMQGKSTGNNGHFNETYARYLVSDMYHFENGRKYVGEKFDMNKAKEVCERYRGIIPQTITQADVYVAINSQYHDYCELFKSWFGEGVEQKIIESAVVFWFKDADYKNGSKIWNYFKEV